MIATYLTRHVCDRAGRDFVHSDDLCYVCLDLLARIKILLGASVVLDHIGSITVTVNLLCRRGRRKNSFVGLLKVRSLSSYSRKTYLK